MILLDQAKYLSPSILIKIRCFFQYQVRYIGASSMYAWQFAKAQHIAEKNGWTKFISMQNHYNVN
jgi:hypothetical protein